MFIYRCDIGTRWSFVIVSLDPCITYLAIYQIGVSFANVDTEKKYRTDLVHLIATDQRWVQVKVTWSFRIRFLLIWILSSGVVSFICFPSYFFCECLEKARAKETMGLLDFENLMCTHVFKLSFRWKDFDYIKCSFNINHCFLIFLLPEHAMPI